jgi:hypothetical protein
VNADSAFAAAAFPLHIGSQISNVDPKPRGALSTCSVSSVCAHDPGHHAASLEDANLEHIAAASHPLGRAVEGVAESLPQSAGRIT